MRIAIFAAALLFAVPAAAQSDSYSRGFNDGYSDGSPASGDPMSPYVSGTEDGAGARFFDDANEDDARVRADEALRRAQEKQACSENPISFSCR